MKPSHGLGDRSARVRVMFAALLAALGGGVVFCGPAERAHAVEAPSSQQWVGHPGAPGAVEMGEEEQRLHGKELAVHVMRLTQNATVHNFLTENGIATPMPVMVGALPEHARVLFPSALLSSLPIDLLVIFTIGDFDPSRECSDYYVPDSAWYNVFYGAYGVLSKKKDGSWWGYDVDGKPDFHEMLEVPELDYNVLTAGQLGCPPEKRVFKVLELKPGKFDAWDRGDVVATIPSGLHRRDDAKNANWLYYSVFGFPDQRLIGSRPSYEPVTMRGRIFFRRVTEVKSDDRITLVWGAMCPDTKEGNALLKKIIDTLAPVYRLDGEGSHAP